MAVIIMSVGAPPELERAISSILNQSVVAEWVVINSGGGDVHSRLPEGIGGARILSFENVLGPGAARNQGIEITKAPFVAFLAADCMAEKDWVEARLRRHHAGERVVASSVVNNRPNNLVAWASHLAVYGQRLPGTPARLALKYGASYSRDLFHQYGMFEDIRIGEDTEFLLRLGKRSAVAWAPEVRTIHDNPTSPLAAWRDQHGRGFRSGKFWPQNHGGRLSRRVWHRFAGIRKALEKSLTGKERLMARASLPLVALNVLIFEMGATRGKRRPDPVSAQDGRARMAVKSKRWPKALDEWTNADSLSPGRLAPTLGRAEALMKLKRFMEAEAVFSEMRRHWPELPAGHEGIAMVASKTGRWELAHDEWSEVERLVPGKLAAREGRGTALLELERMEEAEALFSGLIEDFPDRPEGYRGLARIAVRRLEWPLALSIYKKLWERFGDVDAIKRKVTLLVNLGRISEAGALLEMLDSAGAKPLARVQAAFPYHMARHDWAAIIHLFERHEKLLIKHPNLLYRYVTILSMLGSPGKALPVIEKSRQRKASREILRITALLLDRQYDEAHDGFKQLWSGRNVSEVPVVLLSALVNAAIKDGGLELANSILDRIDVEAPRNHSGDTLRLTGLFHKARLRGLSLLSSSPARLHVPDPPLETEVIRILGGESRISLRNDHHVGEVCNVWAGWRKSHPAFFPEPSFILNDALEVATRIIGAVDSCQPLSLVRMGDGEGNFLPYRENLEPFIESDRAATQITWWGRDALAEGDGEGVRAELREAIRSADIVGFADLHRICRVLGNGQMFALTGGGKNTRGLLATIDFATRLDGSCRAGEDKPRILTSCHIHEAFAYWGLWDLLLPRMGSVSLITCHRDLAGTLVKSYGVGVEDVHLIPSESKYSLAFNRPRLDRHYPDVFENLRGELSRINGGQVFLVAAGMLGKIYCKWIKDAGGIALDVGSAVDFWCGYETRGLDEASCYRGPAGMAEHFQNLAAGDPRIARLLDAGLATSV